MIINRILMRQDEKTGGILVHKAHIKHFPLTSSNLAPGILNIWVANDFGFAVTTQEGDLWVCIKVEDLMELVKAFFNIKNDIEFLPMRQVSYTEFRGGDKPPTSTNGTKTCPYCQSENTIGHGWRKSLKYIQKRRLCNSCSRTWVSEQMPREIETTITAITHPDVCAIVKEEELVPA